MKTDCVALSDFLSFLALLFSCIVNFSASDRALRKKKEEEEEHDPSNYMMSLNVLAQVASATLEKEPPKQKSKTPTRKVPI